MPFYFDIQNYVIANDFKHRTQNVCNTLYVTEYFIFDKAK